MAKYVLVYRGGGGMPETAEEQEAAMAAWGAWMGGLGDAMLDAGNPFGPSATVAPDGSVSEPAPSRLSGYTIVSAESLGAAADAAKGCPVLVGGGSVEVYETFEVM
jgi:hypothetical protein